jgi:hypothetical protein
MELGDNPQKTPRALVAGETPLDLLVLEGSLTLG